MEYLQQEIKIGIFSRLHTDSILNCRLVCKSWNALLHLPYFAEIHLRDNLLPKVDHNQDDHNCCLTGERVGFLFLTMEKSSPLCYLEYDERERSYAIVKRINHPPIKKRLYKIAMVGSCNGLICFSVPYPTYHIDDPVYICNPLTNECMNLPKFDIHRDFVGVPIDQNSSSYGVSRMASGFGYHPLTKQYKVVRIVYYDKQSIGRVQVYTLGSVREWINKGEITYSLVNDPIFGLVTRGVLANGALHWMDFKEWQIVAFDLADEEWSVLPSPPFVTDGICRGYNIRVLGGCLCAFEVFPFGVLNICSLKKSGKWENIFNILYSCNAIVDATWPITLTRTGDLLLRCQKSLIRYDRKTATIETLVEKFEDLGTDLKLDEGIHHTNSFVSLKDLGEISRKIR